MPGANIQACYLLNYSIRIKLPTDEGNDRNEIWTLNKRRNSISCTKLALSVSWTHGLICLTHVPKCMSYHGANGGLVLTERAHCLSFRLHMYILFIIYIIYYIFIFIKNSKISVHLSFYWSNLWFDVWVTTPAFWVIFLGKSAILNFSKM